MSATVTITGNTYPVKDQLKTLGGRWDPDAKGWRVPAAKADEARKLVAGAPRTSRPSSGFRTSSYSGRPSRRRWCRPCGYPAGCSPEYCDECDGEGG